MLATEHGHTRECLHTLMVDRFILALTYLHPPWPRRGCGAALHL